MDLGNLSPEEQFMLKMRYESIGKQKDRDLEQLLGNLKYNKEPDTLGDVGKGLDIATDVASLFALV